MPSLNFFTHPRSNYYFVIFKLVFGRTTYPADNYSENKTCCKKCLQNPKWLQGDVTSNSIHVFKMCCMLERQRAVGKKERKFVGFGKPL